MFFNTNDFSAEEIEVFKLTRAPYRKASPIRPFHAISFRVEGNAKYETTDRTIQTEQGDLLFVPAYVQYVKDTSEELFYVVHFKTEVPIGNQLRCLSPVNKKIFAELFEQLYRVRTEKDFGYEYETKQLFYRLVLLIEREFSSPRQNPIEQEISKATWMIHESFLSPDFSVGDLVKRMNMSETYFRRQFQKYKGVSPKRYVEELRLQSALQLLRSGYYSVTEVADRCGFSDLYYFSAFIKRMTGKSPREIQKIQEET